MAKVSEIRTPMAAGSHIRESSITNSTGPRLSISIGHRHRAQRQALARGELFACALELAAGGENIAPARRAHRRSIAGVENNLGEFLDPLPIRAFVSGAGQRIERDEVDLRRNAREQLDQ